MEKQNYRKHKKTKLSLFKEIKRHKKTRKNEEMNKTCRFLNAVFNEERI